MDTTIEQQVAMDEALVPSAQRLRIRRSNFLLLSDIQSKELTLQLVYDVLRICPFFKAFLVTTNVPKIYMQEFWATANVHHHSIRFKMDNKKHIVNLESFREMLHICPRILEVAKHDDKDDTEESGDDDKESGSDEEDDDEETRDEESFDPITRTPESSEDEGDGEEDQGLNVDKEEEDELYRDVNINQGRGIQATLEVEDFHVNLTLVNPDGQQESLSVSLQFMTSMLNPISDAGMESIFKTTSTSVAPLLITAQTMTPSTIATITTTSQALINKAVKVAVQIQTDRLRDASQRENDEFLRTIDENIKKIIKEKVKDQVKMEGNKSIQCLNEQRNLYKVLVEAYEANKIILNIYGEAITLKRRRNDDADKDKGPSAGPERGSKRRREGKEPESASAPSEPATRSACRSTTRSRSRQVSASDSTFTDEPMQTTSQMEEPSHPEFETGAEDQPIVQSSQHPKWFSQPQKPPTPDYDWNNTLPPVYESIQPWIRELAKQADTRSSFNELMDTPLDFSNFLMNWLSVDTLTPEVLARPTYELMKGSCKSLIELKYHLEKVYKATTDQLDLVNPEGQHFAINRESARDVYSKRRIITVTKLKIVEWHSYKHLDWITVRRDDDKLYNFKEGDFKRLRLQDIEDMLLLLVQRKLNNLTVKECFAFNVSLRMFTRSIVIRRRVEDLQLGVESYQKKLNLTKPDTYRSDLKHKEAYTAYSNPQGFIYQNKDKKNKLMRIDKLHKFSDGTLTDVRTALDDRLKEI
nr:hypothetical protein [Tanacetum cinerariifolium]